VELNFGKLQLSRETLRTLTPAAMMNRPEKGWETVGPVCHPRTIEYTNCINCPQTNTCATDCCVTFQATC
jgi:hypothetical protein